jgi:DNA-binding response OmpR family regulator
LTNPHFEDIEDYTNNVHPYNLEGMNMTKVLCVDYEPSVLDFLRQLFEDAGYEAVTADDGVIGLREFFSHHPDVVVTELLMPHMDGIELCRRIREISQVPIIVLSTLYQVGEKVNALNAGADDYVTKPVSGRELVARVEAHLRRASWGVTSSGSVYSDPRLRIDFERREVLVDGECKELTPIEYSLLSLFVKQPGAALSLEYLLRNVWGWEYDTFDLVKWHISNLRKKLGVCTEAQAIVTVRGYGYRYKTAGV